MVFKHPYVTQVDYFEQFSMGFIGLTISSNFNLSAIEVFIELKLDLTEQNFSLNKIFTYKYFNTITSITDPQMRPPKTLLKIDKNTFSILDRGSPSPVNDSHLYLDFNDTPLQIFPIYQNGKPGLSYITNNSTIYSIYDSGIYTGTQLTCNFSVPGNYTFAFQALEIQNEWGDQFVG